MTRVIPAGCAEVHDLAQQVEPERRAQTDRRDGEEPADDRARAVMPGKGSG